MTLSQFTEGFLKDEIVIDIRPPDPFEDYHADVRIVSDFLEGLEGVRPYSCDDFYDYIIRGCLEWTHLSYNPVYKYCSLCRGANMHIRYAKHEVTIKELSELIKDANPDAEPLSDLIDQVFV